MLLSFRSFLNNFTLDNSEHVFSAWQVEKKKKQWTPGSPKYWIYFKTTVFSFSFFVSSVQIDFPTLYINQALLLNSFFKRIFWISLVAYEVKCAWYFHEIQFWHSIDSVFDFGVVRVDWCCWWDFNVFLANVVSYTR